jgi:hypothetical protein
MLNGNDVLAAVTAALKTIPDLVAAMNGDATRIFTYSDIYGSDAPRKLEEYKMLRPSILVEWMGQLGGNFDGSTLTKHQIQLVIRQQNAQQVVTPTNFATLWYIICNAPINSGTVNIRGTCLLPDLDPPDTPTATIQQDETGNDILVGHFSIPEVWDVPYTG